MDEPEMARLLDGVVGFLHPDEAVALYEAVRQLDVEPVRIVELGACLGRSAVAMGTALQARGHGELHSVDTFQGTNLDEFTRNVAARGLESLVHPWKGLTHDVRGQWDRGPIGMIFIDASHDYANVRQDLDDWEQLFVPGATVVFNDASLPGVHRLLSERVFVSDSPYVVESLVRSTLFTTYRPGTPLDDDGGRRRDRIARVLRVAPPRQPARGRHAGVDQELRQRPHPAPRRPEVLTGRRPAGLRSGRRRGSAPAAEASGGPPGGRATTGPGGI